MEADSGGELVEWTRIFGLSRLLKAHPEEIQQAWEAESSSKQRRLVEIT